MFVISERIDDHPVFFSITKHNTHYRDTEMHTVLKIFGADLRHICGCNSENVKSSREQIDKMIINKVHGEKVLNEEMIIT